MGESTEPGPEPEEIRRLWEHGLHEDNMFTQRLQFFLLVESVLLASATTLKSRASFGLVPTIVVIVGLLVTALWCYVQVKEAFYVTLITRRLMRVCPEFRETHEDFRASYPALRRHHRVLEAFAFPLLVTVLWVAVGVSHVGH